MKTTGVRPDEFAASTCCDSRAVSVATLANLHLRVLGAELGWVPLRVGRAPRRPSNGRAGRDERSPSRPRSPPSSRPPYAVAQACPPCAAYVTAAPASRCDLLQQRVDAREARLRALFDAVLHRSVPLLGRLEAHRLRQLRLLTEILELERLQVVLERLHEALGWLDLAEHALDVAEGGSEPVGAAGTDVHLLDDGAVAPPFRDPFRIRSDRVD